MRPNTSLTNCEERRLKVPHELIQEVDLTGHGLCAHHVCSRYGRTAFPLDPGLKVAPLSPQPQGKRRYLDRPRVDVHAVQVVTQDQPGHSLLELGGVGEVAA
jgi:ribosomal protein L32